MIVLEHLDNSSLLLMYLAGELPASEQARVAQRVANDAALRAELEQLRSLQAEFLSGMTRLDATHPISEPAAIARITRAMRHHEVRRLVLSEPSASHHFWRRVPRWAYPLTAAAALVLAYIGYWTTRPMERAPLVAINTHDVRIPVGDSTTKPESDDSGVADFDGLERNLRSSNPTQVASFSELRRMERQMADLSQSANDPLQSLLSDNLLTEDE